VEPIVYLNIDDDELLSSIMLVPIDNEVAHHYPLRHAKLISHCRDNATSLTNPNSVHRSMI
jgi:hypothetical protein